MLLLNSPPLPGPLLHIKRGGEGESGDLRIATPLGTLGLKILEGQLASIEFLPKSATLTLDSRPLFQKIISDVLAYFNNPRHCFQLGLHLQGTDFQKKVWKALQTIPSGEVLTYQALAQVLKTSPRAIGNACRANPLPIVIPCHRVVAKQGLGGYAGEIQGEMLMVKQWLLNHESLQK